MKQLWNRLTLMDYATENDPGEIKPWHAVVAVVVLIGFYLMAAVGDAAGF